MKKTKVISYRNLPTKTPFWTMAVTYLYLDTYNMPGWVWGMAATLFAIIWIVAIVAITNQVQVDITKGKLTDE